MKRHAAFLEIIRPLNVVIAGLSVGLAAALVRPHIACFTVLCAVVSTMLITAGANVINDLCDVDIDRINKPARVLPAGRMSLFLARRYTIILFVCGVFFSIFIGFTAAVIALGTTLLLVAYSIRLKRQPLTGNLAVSLATALAFIYGALAACREGGAMSAVSSGPDDWRAGILPAVFSFLFHFGREVVKDLEDQEGDRALRARTLPLAYGLWTAQLAATIAFALLAVAVLMPFLLGIYRMPYFWLVMTGIYPVLGYALLQVWRRPDAGHMRQVSALLKADMFVGLLAIFLGTYYPGSAPEPWLSH